MKLVLHVLILIVIYFPILTAQSYKMNEVKACSFITIRSFKF